jgi:hypothetical protein
LICPVSEKYFLYISSALREKSGVALRTIPGNQWGSNIIEEFSSICTVALKTYYVN